MRPVDLAREHGLSAQAIRNYEASGVVPSAERSQHGYLRYTPLHAQAVRTFLALIPGHGHQDAASIMRAVNSGSPDNALRVVDEGHATLLHDRATLRAVERALADLAPATADAPTCRMFIGQLAHTLGIEPATLRKWEQAGLVRSHRDPRTGYRVYSESDVREARMVRQLRRGGYPLDRIATVVVEIRSAGGVEPMRGVLDDWHERLAARGRAMLAGAAALDTYLRVGDGAGATSPASQ